MKATVDEEKEKRNELRAHDGGENRQQTVSDDGHLSKIKVDSELQSEYLFVRNDRSCFRSSATFVGPSAVRRHALHHAEWAGVASYGRDTECGAPRA
eukprot:CAMPEP_0174855382 /NCGR_PEP_ID=MMETSP1114-20130205/33143_1 /TAXON_ID=312471 /ORGANISM="Neobodo designis, Strain CCAP 1951/1" /LENGTH=96 /DNA_ID=CAMNT_0016090121 /DNA_START=143 /DNA_END=434 /DNA_ORIENTATION=+